MQVERRGDKARELLKRVAAKERGLLDNEFLSPYGPGIKSAVVRVEGLPYRFRIVGSQGTGYGIFKPVDPSCAKYIRDAEEDLTREYLRALPSINFVLVCQTDQGWCGYPSNMESACKKLGLESEAIIREVTDAERFDIVTARYDGLHFWFDDLFAGEDPTKAEEMRECFSNRHDPAEVVKANLREIKGLAPEERRAFKLAISSWELFRKHSTEGQLKQFLERGGAELDSFVIRGKNIEVRWSAKSGNKYNSLVNKESLDVVASGICLSGGDRRFHFKDLPGVIDEGEERGLIYTQDHRGQYVEDRR